MQDYITIHQWLPLKKETRDKLKALFYIKSTGMVEVETDQFGKATVKNDGFTNTDLQVITVEKLVDFVGSAAVNENIYDLWKRVIDKIELPQQLIDEGSAVVLPKEEIKTMNTADNQLQCDRCPFKTGSARGLKIHKSKHSKIKVA